MRDMRITNNCDGRNGSDFVTPDNFKINVVGGKSEIIISSIYIGSTEFVKILIFPCRYTPLLTS
jgi:hypothetical protein